jgi:hypothetical protein
MGGVKPVNGIPNPPSFLIIESPTIIKKNKKKTTGSVG